MKEEEDKLRDIFKSTGFEVGLDAPFTPITDFIEWICTSYVAIKRKLFKGK